MTRAKNITEKKHISDKDKAMMGEFLDEFVSRQELTAAAYDTYEDPSIPVMMRLQPLDVAILDHIAERWHTTRSSLAGELLGAIIQVIARKVYEDKTQDEFNDLIINLWKEFEKKKSSKNKKEKK